MKSFFRNILPRLTSFSALRVFLVAPIIGNALTADLTKKLVGGVIGGVSDEALSSTSGWLFYVIGYLASLGFTLSSWLINHSLDLSKSVLVSPTVEVGWLIARDFTNLALVIVVVVMAFGTMLRTPNYGIKKNLANVIMIALLINFSLTIAGVFIDFSNTITDFFVKKTIPPNSNNISSLGDSLAQAFQPQQFLNVKNNKPIADTASLGEGSLRYLGGLFFGVIFTIIGTIAFFGIGAMLFVRYIALAILLVLVPLAYLSKVLPGLDDYTKKWWGTFLNWLLFGPICTFFLYIAIITITKKSQITASLTINSVSLAPILGKTGTETQFGDMIMILALMMASLMAAKQLGIYGSDTFLGAAKSVTGWAQGKIQKSARWAGRKAAAPAVELAKYGQQAAIRAATFPTRTVGFQKKVESLQKSDSSWVKRKIGNVLQPAGKLGEGLIKDAGEEIKDIPDDQLALRFRDMSHDKQVAALARLSKAGKLNKVPNIESYMTPGMRNEFTRYGQTGAFVGMEKNLGFNAEMAEAQKAQKAAEEAFAKDPTNATLKTNLDNAKTDFKNTSTAFYGKWSQEDWRNINTDLLSNDKYKNVALDNLLENAGAIRNVMAKIKSEDRKKITDLIQEAEVQKLNEIMKTIDQSIDVDGIATPEQKLSWLKTRPEDDIKKHNIKLGKLEAMHKAIDKNLDPFARGQGPITP